MKKILIILSLLLVIPCFIFAKNFICYYRPNPDYHNFRTNCELVAGYFKNQGYNIEYEELTTDSIDKSFKEFYDVVMFSTHGLDRGLLVENFDTGKRYTVRWDLLRKVRASILIVDACYSGNIFLNTNISQHPYIIITSSTPKAATYTYAINHIYTDSFAMTFACFFDKNYDCPVDYKECQPDENNDFGACQLKLSLEFFTRRKMMTNDKFDKDKFNEYTFNISHDGSMAMGISMINGNVIRHIDLEKYR